MVTDSEGQYTAFGAGYGPRRGTALGGQRQSDTSKALHAWHTLFDEDAGLIDTINWLKTLDHLAKDKQKDGQKEAESFRDAVQKLLCRVLPGVTSVQIDGDGVRIQDQHKRWLPLQTLSDGYLTTAGWVLDIVARWWDQERKEGRHPGSDFLLRMTGIVLIDEVDLHLHPAWQWNVVETLRETFKHLSFVVTTHNPVTLLGAQAGEVWVLEASESGEVRCRPCDIPRGTDAGALLTGPWFGLPSIVDHETLALVQEHGELLRSGANPDRKAEVAAELERRLKVPMDGPLERLAIQVVAEELKERFAEVTLEDRRRAREKAKQILLEQRGRS